MSIYGVNTSEGYFKDMTSGTLITFTILTIVVLAAILVLAQFKFSGLLGKVLSIFVDALKIVVPLFLMICLFGFISTRIEGLAYLFGSNQEILDTIQTPENMSSAYGAITGFVFFGIASIAGMVAAFFNPTKKESAKLTTVMS